MAGNQAQGGELDRWRQWRLAQDYLSLGLVRGDLVLGERGRPRSGSTMMVHLGGRDYLGRCYRVGKHLRVRLLNGDGGLSARELPLKGGIVHVIRQLLRIGSDH